MSASSDAETGDAEGSAAENAGRWSVYILRCADQTLYTGISNRLAERLQAHSEGRGAKYTRSRLPVELVFTETRHDRSGALRREAQIKTYTRAEKMALIATASSDGAQHREDKSS